MQPRQQKWFGSASYPSTRNLCAIVPGDQRSTSLWAFDRSLVSIKVRTRQSNPPKRPRRHARLHLVVDESRYIARGEKAREDFSCRRRVLTHLAARRITSRPACWERPDFSRSKAKPKPGRFFIFSTTAYLTLRLLFLLSQYYYGTRSVRQARVAGVALEACASSTRCLTSLTSWEPMRAHCHLQSSPAPSPFSTSHCYS